MRLPIRRTLSKQQLLPLAIVVLAVIASAYILLIDRRAASPPPATVVVVCDGEKAGDFACWSDRYKAITTNVSAEEAFIDLRRAYADSTYVQSQCHQITHVIGRTAATINPTIAEAYKKGDSFCSSGYYHGVVEQVATSMGKQEFVAQLNTICTDVEA